MTTQNVTKSRKSGFFKTMLALVAIAFAASVTSCCPPIEDDPWGGGDGDFKPTSTR